MVVSFFAKNASFFTHSHTACIGAGKHSCAYCEKKIAVGRWTVATLFALLLRYTLITTRLTSLAYGQLKIHT